MSLLEVKNLEDVKKAANIFGNHFLNVGGEKLSHKLFSNLGLYKNSLILDVGSKLGGTLEYLNSVFDSHCVGIEENQLFVEYTKNYFSNENINIITADIGKYHLPKNHFDVIICRDFLVKIKDKETLLEKFYNWLKPGGKIYLTIQCTGRNINNKYTKFNLDRTLEPINLYSYVSYLNSIGFDNIKIKDNSNLFINSLEEDLFIFEHNRNNFIDDFTEADYEKIYDIIYNKKTRCLNNNLTWGNIIAIKPFEN